MKPRVIVPETGDSIALEDVVQSRVDDARRAIEIIGMHGSGKTTALRGCMFHMGSSRSGLVDSPYPGHGSRTGFYTDAYDDRYYKSPEEIRKANLCGADLRGANIFNVDFYLVDLRGAKYDRQQADHFRRCDAILESD